MHALFAPGCLLGLQVQPKPMVIASMEPYMQAAKVCSTVLARPGSSESWSDLGSLLHQRGRIGAARLALARAAELAPEDAELALRLALVLRESGRHAEARALLLEAESLPTWRGVGREHVMPTGRHQSLLYARAEGRQPPALPAASRIIASVPATADPPPPSGGKQIWSTPVASRDECRWIIATAEAEAESRGGWERRPPRYVPGAIRAGAAQLADERAGGAQAYDLRLPPLDMVVGSCPPLLRWLDSRLEQAILPALAAQFGVAPVRLWLYDAFILKYEEAQGGGQPGLGLHIDDSDLSFNILLSSPDAFSGGGTWFQTLGRGVFPAKGEMLSHHGKLPHAGSPVTAGTRYVMVGFVSIDQDQME
jgi:hypothetical protein